MTDDQIEQDPGLNREAIALNSITDSMQQVANLVAGHQESTFTVGLLTVQDIGKFEYHQLGHEIDVKFVQQRARGELQPIEIDRGFNVSDEGCKPKLDDVEHKIVTKRADGTIDMFRVVLAPDRPRLQPASDGKVMPLEDVEAAAIFAANLAAAAPAAIAAKQAE